ncbi:SgcJ/EcaC family oxidoreductase [Nonomuraea sp. NPDC001684]
MSNTLTAADAAAITSVLDRLADAWNRADGGAYGDLFTEDATYITYVGTLYTGAREIGDAHQALFDSFVKGTRLASETVGIRLAGPGTALVITRGDTYKGKPGKLHKIQTYTMVRQADGDWKIAAFQNTKHQALIEAISFTFQPASKPAAHV